ncbi:hypothetical protein [Roseomonas xinghualingensis]|uniref:hypothetical protein n=1 Tax=Roseomonas xinghualingensis TaxID=2986475 RepID=UPI0021F1DFE1|nr:hypothetical protein [Roseomonas sp. SXEYE001]MCV4207558.1 hypothetical protein [Roseomonas sp. SXEYE001]
MSAALSAEPPPRKPRARKTKPAAPIAPPGPRLVNKRDLCREAGISRTTLDECLARDPAFPIVKRGGGNGDGWKFNAELAVARLAELLARTEKDLSPNQRFMELRARDLERKQAIEAGGLLIAEQMRGALARGLTALRRELTSGVPVKAGKLMGLSKDQQRILRGLIEDELRAFVAGLEQTGLPDADG